MQPVPSLAAESADAVTRRRERERNHEKERRHADHDVRALCEVLHEIAPVELHVEQGVGQPVHHEVAEREESERAPVLREPVPPRDLPERRDRERGDDEPQRPLPEEVLALLHRVRAEIPRVGDDVRRHRDCRERRGNATEDDEDDRKPLRLSDGPKVQVSLPHPFGIPNSSSALRIRSSFADPSQRTSTPPAPRTRCTSASFS